MTRDKSRLQVAYKNEKGSGWIGWLICKIKRWNVWHEEIIFPTRPGKPWSNKVSVADNKKGISSREGSYSHPERWQFVTVYEIGGRRVDDKMLDDKWENTHLKHKGEKYSLWDIFWTQIIPLGWNQLKRWFCDEWSRFFREKAPYAIGAEQSKAEAIMDAIIYMAAHPYEFLNFEEVEA